MIFQMANIITQVHDYLLMYGFCANFPVSIYIIQIKGDPQPVIADPAFHIVSDGNAGKAEFSLQYQQQTAATFKVENTLADYDVSTTHKESAGQLLCTAIITPKKK